MTELRGLAVLVGICLLWAAWYTPAHWAAATDALTASICAAPRQVCAGQRAAPAAALAIPADDYTPESWARALLAGLGDVATADNVRAVVAWERAEGGHWSNGALHNPLNTTQREPGSWSVNAVGVQAFTSWAQGLAATRATLANGRYGGVLAALRTGSCAACVAAAVGASSWGTGPFTA